MNQVITIKEGSQRNLNCGIKEISEIVSNKNT